MTLFWIILFALIAGFGALMVVGGAVTKVDHPEEWDQKQQVQLWAWLIVTPVSAAASTALAFS